MGIDGVPRSQPLPTTSSACFSIDSRDDRSSASEKDCPSPEKCLETANVTSYQAAGPRVRSSEDDARRRTSLPATFSYGSDLHLGGKEPSSTVEERRWRSFDCGSSSRCSSKLKSISHLNERIRSESTEMEKTSCRFRRSRRVFRAVSSLFSSSSKKEEIRLRQTQLVAEVAQRNRSLVILNDLKTFVSTLEEDDKSIKNSPRDSLTMHVDNRRLLESVEDTDRVLAEDVVHHTLSLQSVWLQKLLDSRHEKRKSRGVHKTHRGSLPPCAVMNQFLAEFVRPNGCQLVPCAFDEPTEELIRFETLVNELDLIKKPLRVAFDRLCHDSLRFRSSSSAASSSRVGKIFEQREARDVLHAVVREITEAIAKKAIVTSRHRGILGAFVEQMMYSRLACACYRDSALELDELNATWREQILKTRRLALHEVGLPSQLLCLKGLDQPSLFKESISAFNRIPHLVPSCVLAAFLRAIRVMYTEARVVFRLSKGCICADIVLPLLVYILSHSDLPHLHSQFYLIEQYAIDTWAEGSEAAYYVACLQAAIAYIMSYGHGQAGERTEEGVKKEGEGDEVYSGSSTVTV